VLRFRDLRIAKAVFQAMHLGLHREQTAECAAGLLEDGAAGVREAVLREIPDGQGGRLQNSSGVRLVQPGHHLQEGGLAGAVRAAEADPFTVRDLPRDAIEQDTVPEGLGEL
jgi:hypothetical protein